MLRIVISVLAVFCVLASIFQPATLLAAPAEQIEMILRRLEALEKENTGLKEKVRALEGRLKTTVEPIRQRLSSKSEASSTPPAAALAGRRT